MSVLTTPNLLGALEDAHAAIADLAGEMRRLGERHAADHDVLAMSRTLGFKLDGALGLLAAQGERLGHGLKAPEPDMERSGGPLAPLRIRTSRLMGSRPSAGALLLEDLRQQLAHAADASVACVVLAQGAQAGKDQELLQAVGAAHDTVLRTHRWALTRLKTTAPQVLAGP